MEMWFFESLTYKHSAPFYRSQYNSNSEYLDVVLKQRDKSNKSTENILDSSDDPNSEFLRGF